MSGILGGPDDDELLSILCDGEANLVGGTTALLLDHAPHHVVTQQQQQQQQQQVMVDYYWVIKCLVHGTGILLLD